jgi:protein-disulfide isomerase/uncharacterized membrane protein
MATSSSSSSKRQHTTASSSTIPDGYFYAGIIFLAIAVGCTLALVMSHFKAIELPGCRHGGACEELAASPWGKVPRTHWPISFVGLAYLLGLLIAWLGSKGGVVLPRNIVRLGAAVSLLYVIVLIVEQKLCIYCLATHLANFAFWIVLERCSPSPVSIWRPVGTMAIVFLLTTAALGAIRERESKAVQQTQETQLAESTREIIKKSSAPVPTVQPSATAVTTSAPAVTDRPWKGGFTGHYLRGSKMAPIRIVILTDYQCPDCLRTERDIHSVMQRRPDVSLSVKHFPMCADCNPNFTKEHDMHPNACWAARAAETAGILRGNDGFWQMHDWLFNHRGAFTNDEFTKGLQDLGYAPDEISQFNTTMMGRVTLDLVKPTSRGPLVGGFITRQWCSSTASS